VTGWPIRQDTAESSGEAATIWHVADSAYCYEVVKSFWRRYGGEQAARDLAFVLNANERHEQKRWEREQELWLA
jgi:hypothetical protein